LLGCEARLLEGHLHLKEQETHLSKVGVWFHSHAADPQKKAANATQSDAHHIARVSMAPKANALKTTAKNTCQFT
jgi:hypothetical protein